MADEEAERERRERSDSSGALNALTTRLDEIAETLERSAEPREESAARYCYDYCQTLVQFSGGCRVDEEPLEVLELYSAALLSFTRASRHICGTSEHLPVLLERLGLSCAELLISLQVDVPDALWDRFRSSVQGAHSKMQEKGFSQLDVLSSLARETGVWTSPVLQAILKNQDVEVERVREFLAVEGVALLKMRVKQLMKQQRVEEATRLAQACTHTLEQQQQLFRQIHLVCVCSGAEQERVMEELSRVDCGEALEMICNLEADGDERAAFTLCSGFLTRQMLQEDVYCAWELTLFWGKLLKRLESSEQSFLQRCRQMSLLSKTVFQLLFFIKVVQSEVGEAGLSCCVDLCVRALRLEACEGSTKATVCRTISCLLSSDLEVKRACQLSQFLLEPTVDSYYAVETLFNEPDQKPEEENLPVSNSLRCELLLVLKTQWPFDPEFWDWKTLKRHCLGLMGEEASIVSSIDELNDEGPSEKSFSPDAPQQFLSATSDTADQKQKNREVKKLREKGFVSARFRNWQAYMQYCVLCDKEFLGHRIVRHAQVHVSEGRFSCPICLQTFDTKETLEPHVASHVKDSCKERLAAMKTSRRSANPKTPSPLAAALSASSGQVLVRKDGSRASGHADGHACPVPGCGKAFRYFRNLVAHVKDHGENEDARRFLEMQETKVVCQYCRRQFVSVDHLNDHLQMHCGVKPYICIQLNCKASFHCDAELLLHKKVHTFFKARCMFPGCGQIFLEAYRLYDHEAQHYKTFTCRAAGCGKVFRSQSDLSRHSEDHQTRAAVADPQAGPGGQEQSDGVSVKHSVLKMLSSDPPHAVALQRSECLLGALIASSSSSQQERPPPVQTPPHPVTACAVTSHHASLPPALPSASSVAPMPANGHVFENKSVHLPEAKPVPVEKERHKCPYESCPRDYSSYRSVTKHMKAVHSEFYTQWKLAKKRSFQSAHISAPVVRPNGECSVNAPERRSPYTHAPPVAPPPAAGGPRMDGVLSPLVVSQLGRDLARTAAADSSWDPKAAALVPRRECHPHETEPNLNTHCRPYVSLNAHDTPPRLPPRLPPGPPALTLGSVCSRSSVFSGPSPSSSQQTHSLPTDAHTGHQAALARNPELLAKKSAPSNASGVLPGPSDTPTDQKKVRRRTRTKWPAIIRDNKFICCRCYRQFNSPKSLGGHLSKRAVCKPFDEGELSADLPSSFLDLLHSDNPPACRDISPPVKGPLDPKLFPNVTFLHNTDPSRHSDETHTASFGGTSQALTRAPAHETSVIQHTGSIRSHAAARDPLLSQLLIAAEPADIQKTTPSAERLHQCPPSEKGVRERLREQILEAEHNRSRACPRDPRAAGSETRAGPITSVPQPLGPSVIAHNPFSDEQKWDVKPVRPELSQIRSVLQMDESSSESVETLPGGHVTCPELNGAMLEIQNALQRLSLDHDNKNTTRSLSAPAQSAGDQVTPQSLGSASPEPPCDKPFVCKTNSCTYRAMTKDALFKHLIKQHNFTDDMLLRMKDHYNFAPFTCHRCSKSFTRNSNLKVHYMSVHHFSQEEVKKIKLKSVHRPLTHTGNRRPSAIAASSTVSALPSAAPGSTSQVCARPSHPSVPLPSTVTYTQPSVIVSSRAHEPPRPVLSDQTRTYPLKDNLPASTLGENPAVPLPRDCDARLQPGEAGPAKPRDAPKKVKEKKATADAEELFSPFRPYRCVHQGCTAAFTIQHNLILHYKAVHQSVLSQFEDTGPEELLEDQTEALEETKEDEARPVDELRCQIPDCSCIFQSVPNLLQHYLQLHKLGLKRAGAIMCSMSLGRFRCDQGDCAKTFTAFWKYVSHVDQEHQESKMPKVDPVEGTFNCPVSGCRCSYSTRSNLLRHTMKKHHEVHKRLLLRDPREGVKLGRPRKITFNVGEKENRESNKKLAALQKKKGKKSHWTKYGKPLLKSQEEASAMCTKRLQLQYACMIKGCDTVTGSERHMMKHYLQHGLPKTYLQEQRSNFIYCKKLPWSRYKRIRSRSDDSDKSEEASAESTESEDGAGAGSSKGSSGVESPEESAGVEPPADSCSQISVLIKRGRGRPRKGECGPAKARAKRERSLRRTRRPWVNYADSDSASSGATPTRERADDAGLGAFRPMGFEVSFLQFLQESPRRNGNAHSFRLKTATVVCRRSEVSVHTGHALQLVRFKNPQKLHSLANVRFEVQKVFAGVHEDLLKQLHDMRPTVILHKEAS